MVRVLILTRATSATAVLQPRRRVQHLLAWGEALLVGESPAQEETHLELAILEPLNPVVVAVARLLRQPLHLQQSPHRL